MQPRSPCCRVSAQYSEASKCAVFTNVSSGPSHQFYQEHSNTQPRDVDSQNITYHDRWAGGSDSQISPMPTTEFSDHPIAPDSEALVEVFFTNRWSQSPFPHKPTFVQNDFLPLTRGEPVLAAAIAETNSKDLSQQQHTHRAFFQAAIKVLTMSKPSGIRAPQMSYSAITLP
ncbi:hypothetical protein SNK05_004221 [Fusarium graminearum]|nr:unnamed protein product [Fusarium graminearum]